MSYKTVQETFWTDPEIRVLSPKDKLLFLYLITNPHSHFSGIYYLPKELMVLETGLSRREIDMGIDTPSNGVSIKYDPLFSVIWVKNMLKYQWGSLLNTKQKKGIANHLKTLHNCHLIKDFLSFYDTLSIPYQYPIDTPLNGDAIYKDKIRQDKQDKKKIVPSENRSGPTFDFSSHCWKEITDEDKALWKEAFPACDIEQELKKMAAWIKQAGAKGRKKNWGAFIVRWLMKEQDHGGTKGVKPIDDGREWAAKKTAEMRAKGELDD